MGKSSGLFTPGLNFMTSGIFGLRKSRQALIVMLLTALSTQTNAVWQVTNFEVFQGAPVESGDWRDEESEDFFKSLSDENIRKTEQFLHQVAEKLSDLQFADPLAAGYFDSLVTKTDGTQAIRVYYYQHPASNAPYAWYSSGAACSSPKTSRKIINLNKNWYAVNGQITDMNYQTLAHELFHAVQFSSEYAKKFKCNGPGWLTEGTADAMGFYLAREIENAGFRNEIKPGNNQIQKVFGTRNYSYPLNLPNKPDGSTDDEYLTSSFWRFLAEEDYASRNGLQYQGSARAGKNYTYLANFFNQPFGVYPGPEGQLTWLDTRMKGEPHIRGSLAHLYPVFAASFADFMEARVGPARGTSGKEGLEQWLTRVYGGCESAGPVGNGAVATMEISIRPVAARCFRVGVAPGAAEKNVFLQIEHDDRAILEQLQIGLPDGTDVRPPIILSYQEDQPPFIAIWTFPNFFANDGAYIISNVAKTPAQTKPVNLNFHFSMSDWDADMIQLPPPPPRPEPPTGAERPTQKEKQKKAVDEMLKHPLENLQPVTRVDRDKAAEPAGCMAMKRQLNLCGPQLKIKLSLSPFDANLSTLSPTAFDTAGAGIMVEGVSGMYEYQQAMVELEKTLEGMDASEISISIPLVDYGFSGSFNNAKIEVNKANTRDRGYEAYGPPVEEGTLKHWRPPTGQVTITHYSHQAIQGTFSAGLVDESLRPSAENPVVAKTISGRFFVPAPVLYDDDFTISTEPLREDMIQSMIQQAPFGTEVMQDLIEQGNLSPEILCQNGVDEEQVKAMGFKQGCSAVTGGALAVQCSCECGVREKEEKTTACVNQCTNKWKRCPLPDAQVTGELAAQVAEYQRLLSERNMPHEVQASLIENFKKMPDWQRKLTLQGFK